MTELKFKSDKYKKSRGGCSRLLDIQCAKCGIHLFIYQKDGPGVLKRIYLDRILKSGLYSGQDKLPLKNIPPLTCQNCQQLLGIPYIYKKENRLAFRLIAGHVSKKIIRSN